MGEASVGADLSGQEGIIIPPEGTILYTTGIDEHGDEFDTQYGLSRLREVDISYWTGEEVEKVGTIARYAPGPIRIVVARTGLSAQELNAIGLHGLELFKRWVNFTAAGEEIDLLQRLTVKRKGIRAVSFDESTPAIERIWEDIGVLFERLKDTARFSIRGFNDTIGTLHEMGVVNVDERMPGSKYDFPIATYLRNPIAEDIYEVEVSKRYPL